MYSRFNYSPSNNFYLIEMYIHRKKGEDIYNEQKDEIKVLLDDFISEDGIIDGTKLQNSYFPIKNRDIFISHSHKDIEKVKAFAGWLYDEFGLNSFIDSCAWGYCDELLKNLDKKYCYDIGKGAYDYNLINYTSSHVHMMLATALSKMINNTECVIFFNTPNSILMKEQLDNIKGGNKTLSPWIYYELLTTSLLPNIYPRHKFNFIFEHSSFDVKNEIKIGYDVSKELQKMNSLNDDILIEWKKKYEASKIYRGNIFPLDILYNNLFLQNEDSIF